MPVVYWRLATTEYLRHGKAAHTAGFLVSLDPVYCIVMLGIVMFGRPRPCERKRTTSCPENLDTREIIDEPGRFLAG